MATFQGDSLGAAVLALLGVPAAVPDRTFRQKLNYLTSVRTGATPARIARLLGTQPAHVEQWRTGKVRPVVKNRAKVDDLYEKFWRFNSSYRQVNTYGEVTLTVSATPDEAIKVNGKPRGRIIIERSGKRDWSDIQVATVEEINADFGELFKHGVAFDIPYLTFHAGDYKITTP